jgi:hypothetical protein
MQTRFNLIAAAILAIAGLCSTISSHHIISIFFYAIGTILILAAFLSKDKKDKLIEEIHSEITNNQNKPTVTSTPIIESYMETAHKIEAEVYRKNVTSLNEDFASRGIWSSGLAIRPIIDAKISHTKTFINNCIKYIESTQNNYLLDKPSVKQLFKSYQTNDITEIAQIIANETESRGLLTGKAIQKEIMPPVISEINNAYDVAVLQIDAM